ncbi:SET and MYND domain-containing protein 4-like [Prorops nasuta]|uniref:SET and MYND domain-containing protein 4-like n=1 Tax=Prorops nasuta TaxID=863751 RepID=UPI0034CD99C8
MENLLLLLNSKLIDANKHVEVFNQFKKLHTYEEYIKFSLCLMYEYEIIPKCNLMRKDAKASEKMRDHGNRIFTDPLINENKFLEAYKKYTIAIALAPHFSRQLALAYANRSAVLFQLKKFQDCIQDINRALSMDYPNDIKGKLFLRKSECLIKLGHEPIKEELDEATKYLDRLPDDNANKGKLESNLKLMREGKITKLIEKLGDRERMQELPKIEKPNEEAPCVSDAVAIKYNENYGRHIVAARKILPGEILLVEKPYSTLLCNDYSYTHCSNCMNIVWASIPCENCTHVVYCSEECKNLHWKKYHDFECTIVSIIKDSMLMVDLFSLRLAVQSIKEVSNWRELKAEVNEVDNWQGIIILSLSQFEKTNGRIILTMAIFRPENKRIL